MRIHEFFLFIAELNELKSMLEWEALKWVPLKLADAEIKNTTAEMISSQICSKIFSFEDKNYFIN